MFKKQLKRRLDNPHVISAKLSGQLEDCYKIKYHQAGYRLVYQVDDNEMVLMVVAVNQRNKNIVYEFAERRHKSQSVLDFLQIFDARNLFISS
jgi:mRNA interferase RelE/StbE